MSRAHLARSRAALAVVALALMPIALGAFDAPAAVAATTVHNATELQNAFNSDETSIVGAPPPSEGVTPPPTAACMFAKKSSGGRVVFGSKG